MKKKFEIVTLDSVKISVDVSLLGKTDDLFFNATDMARPFDKVPVEWLRLSDTGAYIEAFLNMGLSHIKNHNDIVVTRRGRHNGGTWLHHDLGLVFARWLSPLFAVRLDLWTRERLKREMNYRDNRLESKTGYLPMAEAIADSREDVKPYHFSNENNLLYRIILGMSAKEYKQVNGVDSVRDSLTAEQLEHLNDLQTIDTGLIKMGLPYDVRKEWLKAHHDNKGVPMLLQANG